MWDFIFSFAQDYEFLTCFINVIVIKKSKYFQIEPLFFVDDVHTTLKDYKIFNVTQAKIVNYLN